MDQRLWSRHRRPRQEQHPSSAADPTASGKQKDRNPAAADRGSHCTSVMLSDVNSGHVLPDDDAGARSALLSMGKADKLLGPGVYFVEPQFALKVALHRQQDFVREWQVHQQIYSSWTDTELVTVLKPYSFHFVEVSGTSTKAPAYLMDRLFPVPGYSEPAKLCLGTASWPGRDGGWVLGWNAAQLLSFPVLVYAYNMGKFLGHLQQVLGLDARDVEFWLGSCSTQPNKVVLACLDYGEIKTYQDEHPSFMALVLRNRFPFIPNSKDTTALWQEFKHGYLDGAGDTRHDQAVKVLDCLEGRSSVQGISPFKCTRRSLR